VSVTSVLPLLPRRLMEEEAEAEQEAEITWSWGDWARLMKLRKCLVWARRRGVRGAGTWRVRMGCGVGRGRRERKRREVGGKESCRFKVMRERERERKRERQENTDTSTTQTETETETAHTLLDTRVTFAERERKREGERERERERELTCSWMCHSCRHGRCFGASPGGSAGTQVADAGGSGGREGLQARARTRYACRKRPVKAATLKRDLLTTPYSTEKRRDLQTNYL
jgi:hypothetical protein